MFTLPEHLLLLALSSFFLLRILSSPSSLSFWIEIEGKWKDGEYREQMERRNLRREKVILSWREREKKEEKERERKKKKEEGKRKRGRIEFQIQL